MSLEEEWHQNKGEAFAQGFNGEHPDSDVLPLPPELIVTDEELAMYLNRLCFADRVYVALEAALNPEKFFTKRDTDPNTYNLFRKKLSKPPHIMENIPGHGYRINSNRSIRNFVLRLGYVLASTAVGTSIEKVYGENPLGRIELFETIAQASGHTGEEDIETDFVISGRRLAELASIDSENLIRSYLKPLAAIGKLKFESPQENTLAVIYTRTSDLTEAGLKEIFPPAEAYNNSTNPTPDMLVAIYKAIPLYSETIASRIIQELSPKFPATTRLTFERIVYDTLAYWRKNPEILQYEGFPFEERSRVTITPQQMKFFRNASSLIRECQSTVLTEEALRNLENEVRTFLENRKTEISVKKGDPSKQDSIEAILSDLAQHPEGILSTEVSVRDRYSPRQFRYLMAQLEAKGLVSSTSEGQVKRFKLGPNYVPNSFQEDISEASNAITVEEQSDAPQTVQESEAVVVFDSHTETLNEEEELTETSSSSLKDESQTSAEEDSRPKVTYTRRKIVRGGKRELPVSSRSRPKTKRQRNAEAAQISRPNIIYDRQHEVSEEELTDAEYMQMWLAGDQRGIEGLVNRYSAALFRFIYHSIGDYDIAQDILQHVRIQLFLSAPTLRLDRPLKSWLFQVAQNRCRDELRRKKPIHFSELEEDLEEQEITSPLLNILDTAPLPEEAVERDELHTLLDTAIQTLPFKFRMVVLLRYYGQLTFNEIGEALTMPEATAKTYFQRAKPLLRKALGGKDISSILNGDLDVD